MCDSRGLFAHVSDFSDDLSKLHLVGARGRAGEHSFSGRPPVRPFRPSALTPMRQPVGPLVNVGLHARRARGPGQGGVLWSGTYWGPRLRNLWRALEGSRSRGAAVDLR